jgi:two-component system heavy metal sensor histidine kinase CusS
MEEIDVREDLVRIAEYFDGLASDAGVALSVEAEGTVLADRLLLRRALSNLIANAIRFTPAGGTVWVIGSSTGREYAFCVQNPGPVISADQQERIFDRFYRIDPSRAESATSTGLGLAIVRSIMGLHRGRVEVSRTTMGLTEFRLIFPLASETGRLDGRDSVSGEVGSDQRA